MIEWPCFGSINGENKHFGTPRNPCVPDIVEFLVFSLHMMLFVLLELFLWCKVLRLWVRNKLIFVSWVKLYIILKCSAKKFNSATESIANAYDIVQIERIGLYCDATNQFCFFSFSLTSHNHIFLLVSSCKSCIHQPSVSTLWSVHVWAFIMTYESEFKLPEVSVSEHLCHSKWWNHINDDSLHNKPTNCCYLDSMRQQFLLHYSPLIWYRSHSFVWGGSHSDTNFSSRMVC